MIKIAIVYDNNMKPEAGLAASEWLFHHSVNLKFEKVLIE